VRRARALVGIASALAVGACVASDDLTPEGGGWYTSYTSSFPESGGNIRLYRRDGDEPPLLVDERAYVLRFYAPDCILYSPNRESGLTYAACGRRVPVPVAAYPPWRMTGSYEADDDGLRRVDTVRVVDGNVVATVERVPLAEIRRVAESQPPLVPGWQAADRAEVMLEPVITDEPVDVDARDASGRTALMNAVIAKQRDVVEVLLGQGADVNASDSVGYTALQMTIDIFDTDTVIVQRVLAAGAELEVRDPTGATPLIQAAVIKNQPLFRIFLDAGADPCASDDDGETIVDASEGPFPELNRMAADAYARCGG
jgi:hypothetical protein